MLERWRRQTSTFSDRLVGPNEIIARNDPAIGLESEELIYAPSPKSVQSSSTFSLHPSTIESDLQWPPEWLPGAPELFDRGYPMPNRPPSTNTVIAAGSNTTSRHVLNSNTSSGLRTPSLTGMSTSTVPSSSLSSTEPFTHCTPLESDEDGNLIDPRTTLTEYPCAFPFLGCRETRPCKDTWRTHNLMHFKRKPPPPTATCPICSSTFYNPPRTPYDGDGDGGATAWDQRMECLASHIEGGVGMEHTKTDLKLVEYMFQKRAISVIDYQEIVQEGGLRLGSRPVLRYEKGRKDQS